MNCEKVWNDNKYIIEPLLLLIIGTAYRRGHRGEDTGSARSTTFLTLKALLNTKQSKHARHSSSSRAAGHFLGRAVYKQSLTSSYATMKRPHRYDPCPPQKDKIRTRQDLNIACNT